MSNFKSFLFIVFAALLGACDPNIEELDDIELDLQDDGPIVGTAGTAPADGDLGFGGHDPQSVPIELVVADCPGAKRLIGVLSSGTDCTLGDTLPADWAGASLFAHGSPGVAALTDVPSYFDRYCAYDYVGVEDDIGSTEYNPLFAAIEASPSMSRDSVSADCRGEFSQGAGLYDASIGTELHNTFMTNIDWETGASIASDSSARTPIEIAVLDTVSQAAADDPMLTPTNTHGLQIAALIERINCPTNDLVCASRLRNIIAMPREDWTTAPSWVLGGHHGTQGDLALAIYEAVHDWRARRADDPINAPKRLVLNLSLGWDRVDGLTTQLSRGPAAALVDAMRYASCQGAVIVASAGNVSDDQCPQDHTGPLDPAGFETLSAPDTAECALMGALPTDTQNYPVFGGQGDYRPLVHAVGALDEHDRDLFNMRPDAMPRLAALGANGIVDPGAESLAGSSVSAAVVSATAALVWSYRPDLRADQLMQLIYDAGWDVGRTADFQYQGDENDALPVRRVSVCAALDDACTGQGASCPVPGCSATGPAADGHLTAVADAVDLVLADPNTTVQSYSGATDEVISCGAPEDANNLSSPQPELPICSRCNLTKPPGFTTGDDELAMTIEPGYAGMISGLRLITKDELGVVRSRELAQEVVDSLNAQPDTVDVTRSLVEAGDAVSAGIEFVLLDGSTQSNRIPVIDR